MADQEYKYEQGMRYRVEPLAKHAREVRERHEANRIGWNEAAGYYKEHLDEAIEFIRAGKSNLKTTFAQVSRSCSQLSAPLPVYTRSAIPSSS